MNIKRKTLVCIILLAVLVASALAVGIHQFATRPQPITVEQFEDDLRGETYTQVTIKGKRVTAVDADGNRYGFKVEDPYEYAQYILEEIDNFDLQGVTQFNNHLKPQEDK